MQPNNKLTGLLQVYSAGPGYVEKKLTRTRHSPLKALVPAHFLLTINKRGKCLPHGWIKLNTRWGSNCKGLFKNCFVAFLSQWRVKERLLKARSKRSLHKHWQSHKKLNPCCWRVKLSYGNYLSIFPFGGLASGGGRGIRLGKEAKLIRRN